MMDARAHAQKLLDKLAAARDLRDSCERFGLLGHDVAAYADAAIERVRVEATSFVEAQFDRVLEVVSPPRRGEDAAWRSNTARELAQSAVGEDLEAALRDLSRLREGVDRLSAKRRAG